MEESGDEWLTLAQAAELHDVLPQAINYHVQKGNLVDYGSSAQDQGRDPRLRFRRSDVERLPKRSRTRPPRSEGSIRVPDVGERLDRIEQLLEILVGTRENAAVELKARVDAQTEAITTQLADAKLARAQREQMRSRLLEAWQENDELEQAHHEQAADLKAFSDALTLLLGSAIPPQG